MIVVDTSVWIANLRDIETEAVRKLRSLKRKATILVGDLVLLEVLQGARDSNHAAKLEAALRQFAIEPMMDDELAITAARNYRLLRDRGITVRKTNDVIIATFCIVEGHVLLHDDRDFTPFEQHLGLRCF